MNKRVLGPIAMLLAAAVCVGLAVYQVGTKAPKGQAGTYTAGTYTAKADGFGGDVTVTATFTDAILSAVTIDAPNETPDIGGKALPDLTDAAVEKQSADFDGVTGATFTSNAVKEALAKCIAQAKGEPIVEPTPKPTPEPVVGGESFTGKGQGFGGEVVAEITILDGKIAAVDLTGPDETPSIGGKALETLAEQVLAAQSADIDGVSGATFTSDGVKEAVTKAIAASKGEAVLEPTPEPTPEPVVGGEVFTGTGMGFGGDIVAEITILDGKIAAVKLTAADETPAIGGKALAPLSDQVVAAQSADIDGVSGATMTSNGVREAVAKAIAASKGEAIPTPEPTPEPTPAPATATVVTGKGQGFGGDVVAEVTLDGGKVLSVKLTGSSETPAIGGKALPTLESQAVKAQGPNIDGVSGATLTSKGAKEAIAKAMGVAVPADKPAPTPEPTPEPTPKPADAKTVTGEGQGFGGAIKAELTLVDGKITGAKLTGSGETPAIGGAALPTLESQVVNAQGANIDGVSGATLTSNGVREAVGAALGVSTGGSTPAPAAPSKTYNAGTYTGEGQGFGGAVTATVTVSDDAIVSVTITGDSETPGIGGAALDKLAANAQSKGADMDGVSGATLTSNAAKEAVADALAKAKV